MVQVCVGVGWGKGVEGAGGKWNSILEGSRRASPGSDWLTMESLIRAPPQVPSAVRVTREKPGRNREASTASSDCPAGTPRTYCLPSAPLCPLP